MPTELDPDLVVDLEKRVSRAEQERRLVEALRAADATRPAPPPPAPRVTRLEVLLALLTVLAVLGALPRSAFPQSAVTGVENSTNNVVKFGDFANKSIRVTGVSGSFFSQLQVLDNLGAWSNVGYGGVNVQNVPVNCMIGCSPTSFLDSAAFTFSVTPVTLMGAVVDDVGTNAVSENAAGAPRMSGQRIMYFDLSKTTANATAIKVDGSAATQPVAGTGTAGSAAGGVLTVQGVASMTKLLVTPDSVALPANQSVNVAQVAGTNTVTGGVAGIIAVGGNVANAGTATANPVPVGGVFTTTPTTLTSGQTATAQFTAAQNLKHDLTTIAGTAPTTAGKVDVKGADGDVFVRQATAANLNATVVGAAASGAAKAGNPVQVGGVFNTTQPTVTSGQAVELQSTARGAAIVAPGVDNTATNAWFTKITDGTTTAAVISGTTALKTDLASVAGTATVNGGLAGSISVGGTAGNRATITQNPVVVGVEARSTAPTAATDGQQIRSAGDLAGNNFFKPPLAWSCNLANIAATLTQCQAAPSAGYSLYVTGWIATSSTTTAGTYALEQGTGSNCATNPTGVFPQPGTASPTHTMPTPASSAAPVVVNLGPVGIKLPAAVALCAIGVATNTLDIVVSGYIAP